MSAFDVDGIVNDAIAVDGLSDFGRENYRQPMKKMLWSFEHEAKLNEVGEAVIRQRVVDILVSRARVQEYVRRYPEILDEEIVEPLIIVGLPRTGTTMLHRTISADDRMYAPLWYETRFPSPALDWDFTSTNDQRIADATAEMQMMLDANPDLMSIHPMDPMGPDEEIMLLEQSFFSYQQEAMANIPSFGDWLEQQDHTPGYEYLKLLLQFLQWQKKHSGQLGERWALKAPHHLHFMDIVFKVFPDARVVQSHRDPLDTIPSLTSMIHALWLVYSDDVDATEVGRQWSRKFARGLTHTMDVREQVGENRFLDLWFKDTVSQPLQEIQKVYDFLGMEFTDKAKQEMEVWQDFNRRELRPSHEYSLEQFGFTESGLKTQFASYRARFIE